MMSRMIVWTPRKEKRICVIWRGRRIRLGNILPLIKDSDGNVQTSEENVLRRWKGYFVELMNEGNERERRVEEMGTLKQEVRKKQRENL